MSDMSGGHGRLLEARVQSRWRSAQVVSEEELTSRNVVESLYLSCVRSPVTHGCVRRYVTPQWTAEKLMAIGAAVLLFRVVTYGDYEPVEGSRMLGASCYVWNFFPVTFLIFSKYLWRYSCIMKSTGSVVTYLIFEFFIPAVCIVQTVYEMYCYFSLEY